MKETVETVRLTADVVCVRGNDVLLVERRWPPHQGLLALPGGHVDPGEAPETAAARELFEETGVTVAECDLHQIGAWARPERDPRGRYVTIAYLAFVPGHVTAHAGDDAAAVQWRPVVAPGELAFDHNEIVRAAWQTRQQLA